jgi:hypothetical protein
MQTQARNVAITGVFKQFHASTIQHETDLAELSVDRRDEHAFFSQNFSSHLKGGTRL